MEYVIWSIEHQAWWPASCCGYVETLAVAGHFSEGEARKILERANYPPGTFHECMIPVEAFGEYFQRPRTRITPAMIAACRRDVALGAGHECSEWVAAGRCLLCDRLFPGDDPRLYDVARQVSHDAGMEWTDPRTGITYQPPKTNG